MMLERRPELAPTLPGMKKARKQDRWLEILTTVFYLALEANLTHWFMTIRANCALGPTDLLKFMKF